jgi:endo-1,4-beta-xylanase
VKQEVGYNIYLPPDYEENDEKYPVIYWLHGSGGNESSDIWVADAFQKYCAENEAAQMIIVFANGTERSGYRNSSDGSLPVESIIITELIPHIDDAYRTISTNTGRAIEGFSMGGGGALYYAVKYPELFCSVVSYAGAFMEGCVRADDGSYLAWEAISHLFPERLEEAYRKNPALFEQGTAYYWIAENADFIRSNVKIRIVCGALDFLFERNEKLHNYLNAQNIPHEYEVMQETDHNIGQLYAFCGGRGLRFHNTNLYYFHKKNRD